jgi:hypothetical protein
VSPPAQAPPVIATRSRGVPWAAATLFAAVAAAAVLYAFNPAVYSFYPRCLFHATTGLHCPGCGALRGAHEFLHGHWLTALRLNAFVFALLPGMLALWLARRWRRGQRLRPSPLTLSAAQAAWCLAALLGFGILRNLPFYPFTLLAP